MLFTIYINAPDWVVTLANIYAMLTTCFMVSVERIYVE
jgi:hypothetical protein